MLLSSSKATFRLTSQLLKLDGKVISFEFEHIPKNKIIKKVINLV